MKTQDVRNELGKVSTHLIRLRNRGLDIGILDELITIVGRQRIILAYLLEQAIREEAKK